ncbi:MAG: 3,4-dihydroxy-2-butanone-4-phosphate synthase [Pseudomonadales bacterium]|uniref:3,4-dihydroxy-2-butanone 4-phosphate synthase n=1 Tax=Oleiphilus messinensis TaxID=141451 RepID=A0A1Y0I363_9GAMM|nr:bifunctional 3,4-dihydroxy-2-butanone-4-phosphate synthase/GTP cyclohydrolase II [Oleiphilus messinensis]ARU54897.1 3,4-dihydroxy-2-butanone 4-phosphate synthase [Oleiphilus messinensis]MCG8612556.1 3,4-dihydroxy-2-butanone-4-phosphate synthase [Pseudomonadales bacterium]
MALNTIEEIIEDIRQGKMVILMDDEDRENEGDLIIAAEQIRPEDINFMVKHARGLVCLTLTRERCQFLGLGPMVQANNSQFSTAFTQSIEAADGVTTGISAADRAHTVRVAVGRNSQPEDIVQPGHIFPIMAQPGGVLSRAGHTEAGCDLARLAGYEPSSVIVEIMNEDGSMARRPDLEAFAETHGLKIGTIADLIHYRVMNECTIEKMEEHELETEYGTFRFTDYKDTIQGFNHLVLSMGDIQADDPVLVRVHIADTFRDLLGARRPGTSSWPIHRALQKISEEGKGVLVLLNDGNASGDIEDRIKDYFSPGAKTSGSASTSAYLTVGTGSQILRDVGVGKMRLLSAPMKFTALSGFDLEVTEYIPYESD